MNLAVRVSASLDDAYSQGTNFLPTGINLAFGANSGSGDQSMPSGMRFRNIIIPKGATILSASIDLSQTGGLGGDVHIKWDAEAADTAAIFSTLVDFNTRVSTVGHVYETIASSVWGIAALNIVYTTVDLKTIIQEVIDRDNWTSGNALVIFARNNGTVNGNYRLAAAFDMNPARAPLLNITYRVDSPTQSSLENVFGNNLVVWVLLPTWVLVGGEQVHRYLWQKGKLISVDSTNNLAVVLLDGATKAQNVKLATVWLNKKQMIISLCSMVYTEYLRLIEEKITILGEP